MRAFAPEPRVWVPRWWRGELGLSGSLLHALLAPAELGYRGAVRLRNAAYDAGWLRSHAAAVPVVSVGNLAVGGSGKTPVAAWLAGTLAAAGKKPALVLRGYGRDELLLHREVNPQVAVYTARRRRSGVAAACLDGHRCVVLDDGFQHRSLARDLDIVLIAVESWREPRRLLPRGPWREGPAALGRAGFVLVTRKTASRSEAEGLADRLQAFAPGTRVGICHLEASELVALHGAADDRTALSGLAGRSVLAVATLADPRPFLTHLRDAGALVEAIAFADHHEFTRAEVEGIGARAAGRPIVMTRKEAVKMRPLLPASLPAFVLEQEVTIERGGEELDDALRAILGGERE